MIQQGINQLLTQGAIALRLSPDYEKKVEIAKTKQELSAQHQQIETLNKEASLDRIKAQNAKLEGELSKNSSKSEVRAYTSHAEKLKKEMLAVGNKATETTRRLFELDPTRENLEALMGRVGFTKMQQKGILQYQQREDFNEFINNLEEKLRKGDN